MKMKKERLGYFREKLVEKQRQLVEEVGKSALYAQGQEDDSIKDLGDQANNAYNGAVNGVSMDVFQEDGEVKVWLYTTYNGADRDDWASPLWVEIRVYP